jgi:catechol 2,3-dioxygenase-like lactoylglutathione lyase family enzyme
MTSPQTSPSAVTFRSNNDVAIQVPDLARAEAFYAGVLGFRLIARDEESLEFETGALRLYVNRDPAVMRSFVPSFDVSDAAAARRLLEAAGCTAVPMGTNTPGVYIQDPFGFTFDIIQRR